MGLIQAFAGAASNTLANQWLEYFYCDTIPNNVLMVKGKHRVGNKSSNTKGEENVISNGSKIIVNEGQCMIIVEDGKVTEICAEPGGFTFDTSASPSIFAGGLWSGIKDSFKEFADQFKYGGQAGRDQRVYYFNIKEIMDNKFGTQNPVPFRVTYPELGRSFTAAVRCNGAYAFKVADPMKFYSAVAGNSTGEYQFGGELASQMKSELLDSLQPAFAKVSDMGIRYDQIALHNREVKSALQNELKDEWLEKRGLMLSNISINSVTMSPEDMKRIQEFEDRAWNANPNNAAATLVEAQANAMQAAANNQGGAMMGFMGMNMAQNAGGMNAQNLFAMGQQQQMQQQQMAMQQQQQAPAPAAPAAPAAGGWTCACGAQNTGKFCLECGKPKPAPAAAEGWTCRCGAVNQGKFCQECGSPKPAGAPLYKCDKCGWVPSDPHNPPKFCPECGDPFDENDAQ